MAERMDTKTEVAEAISTGVLQDTALEEMDLRGLNWELERVSDLSFRHVELGETAFRIGLWERWTFEGAALRGARFEGADLREGNVESSSLIESRWIGSRLESVRFHNTQLMNSDFSNTTLCALEFSGCDLARTCFRGSMWLGGAAVDAHLGGVNLTAADLSASVVVGADLRAANLFRANLQGTVWIGVDLRGAQLTEADLRDAIWIGCLTEGVEWPADGKTPSASRDALSARLGELDSQRLRSLVLYGLRGMMTAPALGAATPGKQAIDIPDAFAKLPFSQLLEALKMGLPHPEWQSLSVPRSSPAPVPAEVNKVSAPEPSSPSPAAPEPAASEESSPEDPMYRRFSMIEID